MKIQKIIQYLEQIAPPVYQESYDNSGLLVGDAQVELTNALISLDVTEAVVAEAEQNGCNLIIAHHPIVFKGLKRFTGKNYVERVVINAIKANIAIYAIHTNLDNMYYNGVNQKIGKKLGLENCKILTPKQSDVKKLKVVVDADNAESLRNTLFEIGVGNVNNLNNQSFSSVGFQTFEEQKNAAIQIEATFSQILQGKIEQILQNQGLRHYEFYSIETKNELIGAGLIGNLPTPMKGNAFLLHLKKAMKVNCIKHTAIHKDTVQRIALCGGSGGFLLNDAIKQGADVFVSADYKYHEFFDADGKIMIADIGHYESEQFTIELIFELLSKKFSNFAPRCTEINTNPVFYL